MTDEQMNSHSQKSLTAGIVSAYLNRNTVNVQDLPDVIRMIHNTMSTLDDSPTPVDAVRVTSAAEVRKSITKDALVSFIDGKGYKTLRRHLTTHGMTAESYRKTYGLPVDYPMVAESYSERRSALAKSLGLGQGRRKPAAA